MDIAGLAARLPRLDPRVAAIAERLAVTVPAVRTRLDREYERLLAGLEGSVKPYRGEAASFPRLPGRGLARDEVLRTVQDLAARERPRWRDGLASGAVYHGGDDHVEFLNRVYAAASQVNPLHADLWPSGAKFESEIVSMTAAMLGGDAVGSDDPRRQVVGAVTSGGTESILLAMKAYRDRARARVRVRVGRPEVVAPATAHVAFDKAAQYFGIKLVRVPVGADYRADVAAMRRAVTRRTVALVGSAPTFPHGVIDPIEDLAAVAADQQVDRALVGLQQHAAGLDAGPHGAGGGDLALASRPGLGGRRLARGRPGGGRRAGAAGGGPAVPGVLVGTGGQQRHGQQQAGERAEQGCLPHTGLDGGAWRKVPGRVRVPQADAVT